MDTTEIIDKNLREQLNANHVEIIDESHLHRGHKAAGGCLLYTSPSPRD